MVSTLAAVIGLIAVASYSAGTLLQVRTYRNNTLGPSGMLLAAAAVGAVLHGIANYLIVYSGCVAFGLERFAYALYAQFGAQRSAWPFRLEDEV